MPEFTYFAVLASGTETVLEVGPYPTIAEALALGADAVERTVAEVVASIESETILAETLARDVDTHIVIGYTIERYDPVAQETDETWSLNGGRPARTVKPATGEPVASAA